LPDADARGQGAGMIDLRGAFRAPTAAAAQTWPRSTGTGSLEKARGGRHLVRDGVALKGERDIFGRWFRSGAMARAAAAGTSWSGGTWNGTAWTANEWSANEWSGNSWSGNEWSANEWSANEWSANEWSANEWSAHQWLAIEWSSRR
ncbi:MAG: S8 family serine peptidase, partial [Candidatus Limnocylindria bacterium]